jgi:predicted amidophosphoribosyltransferase
MQSERPAAAGTADNGEALGERERTALAILDCVRRLRNPVGRTKLAQILNGSAATDIKQYGYDKNVYYRRLEHFRRGEIEGLIDQLLQQGYFKVVGGKYPVLALTPQGVQAIERKAEIPLDLPAGMRPEKMKDKKAQAEAGGTVEVTYRLFREGLNPEEIARRRGLARTTICGHLSQLVGNGSIDVTELVDDATRAQVEAAIEKVGSVQFLLPIKEILPENIGYDIIRYVVEGWKRAQWVGSSAAESRPDNTAPCSDPAEDFFNRPHPRRLDGNWTEGWALDVHSRYFGSVWQRSCVGELAYRLKYEGDRTALPDLIAVAMNLIAANPQLGRVDAVAPIPPTMERESHPVDLFADALAQRLRRPVARCLHKTRVTQPQKELQTLAQKRANVAGAFAVHAAVKGMRLLLVDDLFDSGATLEEATRTLLQAGAAGVNVLTMTKTIHTER